MAHSDTVSRTWTFYAGDWHEGNVPLWGPRTHAIWLGSSVFDGARAFEGVTPTWIGTLRASTIRPSSSASRPWFPWTLGWVGA